MSDFVSKGSPAGTNDAAVSSAAVPWADPARAAQCAQWLDALTASHRVLPQSLRVATADASFRRYLRVDTAHGPSCIVMDAPPALENCTPFVQVARLMQQAGICAPDVLAWDEAHGFMLLTDLGNQTLMQHAQALLGIDPHNPPLTKQALPSTPEGVRVEQLFRQATATAVRWQLSSKPGVLPSYSAQVMASELMLFPDWYVAKHRGVSLTDTQRTGLLGVFGCIQARNLAAPQVFVHCDFMPRNLMMPGGGSDRLGVIDFQDALHGPITYDIACLMRDAFTSWEDDFVLDVSIRYWENARKAGLVTNGVWGSWADDFGEFWKAVDYMALHRHLRVAGIFARLTHRDGKARYAQDCPRFIRYIRETASRYAELRPLLRVIDQIEGMDADTAHLRQFGL